MNAHSRSLPDAAPRVRLEPDIEKVIAAIAFLIEDAEAQSRVVTQYDIVKALFLADRSHLNEYGRPVTFDNYVAMKHGPVPSLAYDFLKLNTAAMARSGVKSLPWQRAAADHIALGSFRYFNADFAGLEGALSASDIDALRTAATIVAGLSFGQIRKLTHGDAAYKEAWDVDSETLSNPMSLGLLYDRPDFEAAEEVEFLSQQRDLAKSMDDDYESLFSDLKAG